MSDELADQLRPKLVHAVEPLQVAAALESEGLNDKIARDRYGHTDVFSLAEEVYARLAREARPPVEPAPRRPRMLAQLSHGLLYGMPGALLPATSALVGAQWLMPGLVLTTGAGWILGGCMARMVYGKPDSAWTVVVYGLVAGAVAALAIGLLVQGPPALLALCVVQITFQLCSGMLLIHHQEALLAVLMGPGVVAGVTYLVIGTPFAAIVAVVVGTLCIAGVTGAALVLTSRQRAPLAVPRGLLLGLVHSLLTALFLLQAEARYVVGRPDIAIAGAGLVLGMGVLEFRAHCFETDVRSVIRQVCYPAEFTRHGHRLLLAGLGICLAVLTVLSAPPLLLVSITAEGAVMALAHVVLGGAYFLAFLLANQGRVVELCLAQGAALLIHPGLRLVAPVPVLSDTLLFLAACLLFLCLLLVLMAARLRDVWAYR
ncbi:hypothetical protein [Nonomuraea soli]|uniref:Uncharacterized protein n=1 Tax=Nonomuraea soli TaxID=1032476 RepID=A0A7W0CKR2_9ACTN|nr:hypothetical protein [Nonomuraea soli]MBA2892953.1 hypothetical protein [Nonomuraea soli]